MKKLLSFTVAAFAFTLATQASAFDIIHPFYGPDKGVVTSETGVSYDYIKGDKGPWDIKKIQKSLSEDLTYGITNNWTLYGGVEKDWERGNYKLNGDLNSLYKNKADSWYLGTSYNVINDGKNFLQLGGYYGQSKWEASELSKTYSFTGMYGYNFDSVTPYAVLKYSNTLNFGKYNDGIWSGKVAAYKKLTSNLGGELGITYSDATSSDAKEWDAEVSFGYMLNKNMSLNLSASYALDAKGEEWGTKYDYDRYSTFASFKVAF